MATTKWSIRSLLKKVGQTCWFYQPAVLTGIFIGFSYIPFPPWASLFAFVPLWWLWLRAKNWRQVFIAGWVAQFVLTVIGFDWVLHTIHVFGMMPWWISTLGFIGFCSFANLDVAIAGLAWWLITQKILHFEINKRNLGRHLILIAICTLFAKDWYPTIFEWNYGYPFLWMHWPVAQVAELIGFKGLSDIVILLNALSFLVIFHWREKVGRRAAMALVTVVVLFNLAGYALLKSLPKPDAKVNALIVQANIGNLDKIYAEYGWGFRNYILNKFESETKAGLADAAKNHVTVDFVVWPETAYPYPLDQRMWQIQPNYPQTAQPLLNLAHASNAQFLVGGFGYSPKDNKPTNTFYIVQSNNTIQPDPYYKTDLLAFGEYIPFGNWFPKLYQWIPAADFARGPGPVVKKLPLPQNDHIPPFTVLKVGPEICYEGIFSSFARGIANKGAQIFVNINNDSWYGDWQEPYQNFYMTLARAVEYGRPMVRSTNTGISGVMLPNGKVLGTATGTQKASPIYKEWYGVYRIPYLKHPSATGYQKFPWLLHALFVLLFGIVIFTRGYKNGADTSDLGNKA